MIQKFLYFGMFVGRLGSTIICRIIYNSHGYHFKKLNILLPNKNSFTSCSQDKLMFKSSPSKISLESPSFLQRIQEYIYVDLFTT